MLYVNPAYEDIWGESREILYEEPLAFLDAIHPDDTERVRSALARQSGGEYDEEYRLVRPDGSTRWIRDRAVPIENEDGTAYRIAGIAEDITERKERELELAQTSWTLEALATSFPDPVFVIDEDGYYRDLLAGAEIESLLYEEPEELLSSQLDDVLPGDVADELLSAIQHSLATGELQTIEYQLDVPAGSRWFEGRITPMAHALSDSECVVLVARDVTQRKQRERILTGLHDAMQALFRADTPEGIAERAVETARERLQLSLVSIYYFDESAGVLRPMAQTSDVAEVIGSLPTFTESGSLAWEAFVNNEKRVYDGVRNQENVYNPETPIRSELLVPLGDHGVLLAGDTKTGRFGEMAIEFVELLATNVSTALDQLKYERNLERQNERLVDLSRLNSAIRSINRAIIDATTREEIAEKVCENIVEGDTYLAAWIGEYRTRGEIALHARMGPNEPTDATYWDSLDVSSLAGDLVEKASETRTIQELELESSEAAGNSVPSVWLSRGCRGVVAVPLTAGKAIYGILTLYTEATGGFDEQEVSLLEELGQTIGRAIRAIEVRRVLLAETATELTFEITDENPFFVAASRDFECRLSLEGLVPLESGRLLVYVSAEGVSPPSLQDRATESTEVETCRTITETDDGGVFEFRVSEGSAVLTLVDYGAAVRSAVADEGKARVTAEITPETDPQTIQNGLQDVCPSATLLSKRDLDRPLQNVQQFRESLTDQLTEKQLYTLRSAYYAGYFDWPRESTAEAIAEPMDVASSRLHFHLRHGLRKLLWAFFETQSLE